MENKKLERYQAWEQRLQELNQAQKAELLRADLAQKDAKEAKKRAAKIAAEYEDVLFRGAENYNPDPTPLFSEAFGTVPLEEAEVESVETERLIEGDEISEYANLIILLRGAAQRRNDEKFLATLAEKETKFFSSPETTTFGELQYLRDKAKRIEAKQ